MKVGLDGDALADSDLAVDLLDLEGARVKLKALHVKNEERWKSGETNFARCLGPELASGNSRLSYRYRLASFQSVFIESFFFWRQAKTLFDRNC